MSVINEALKQAEGPEKSPSLTPNPSRSLPMAWWVAIFAVLIAMVSLYVNEFQSRQKAQAKLQAALLQLNDARSEAMTAMEQKEWALAEKKALAAKTQEVEYDNFEKEKKISDLSKEVHELKMVKMAEPSSAHPAQA